MEPLTAAEFMQIARSRAELPRAARRVGLTGMQVQQIKFGQLTYPSLMSELHPDGLRVRLDAPMSTESGNPRAPQAGTEGNVTTFGLRDWNVWWENGSNLGLLVDADQFTVLGPARWPDRLVCVAGTNALVAGREYTVTDRRGVKVDVVDEHGAPRLNVHISYFAAAGAVRA